MWANHSYHQGTNKTEKKGNGSVAVAIDNNKGSQHALKWAIDHLLTKGQTVTLIHVNHKVHFVPTPNGNVPIGEVNETVATAYKQQIENQNKEFFLPYRCFCTRKDIQCKDVILEDYDVAKGIIEYVTNYAIENLVVGCSSHNAFVRRFKAVDIPTSVSKGAPDFCNVYIISKGKTPTIRSASRPAPALSPPARPPNHPNSISSSDSQSSHSHGPKVDKEIDHGSSNDSIKSPFNRGGRATKVKSYGELSLTDSDISMVSSDRGSLDSRLPAIHKHIEGGKLLHERNTESYRALHRSLDFQSLDNEFSLTLDNERKSWSPQTQTAGDVEAEMKRLKLELKQTMDMYTTACKEALTAKQKANELHRRKMEEDQRLEEARLSEEAALAMVEKEKAKCKAAIEAAEAAQRIAELEAQKRINAERKALKEEEEKNAALDALAHADVRYRKYTIDEIEIATDFFSESRKIGEGGYGPVYKCYLDHTPVAVKVLRPDAAQGRSQFQQEVEVLSCIRHPNMVLLLGACPEYGCLVYEYLSNGSLEDCLFHRGNHPALTWQMRFRIAAEIATGLLFLHQSKPEPLVHRDLKPGNILLDRNFVSKISDVGLARLVPSTVANNVTQYLMTSTAGTFCYIDPEYQQTGMLGTKSDIYSIGIMFLQLLTAKPPMGLTHHVEWAIEKESFSTVLDPSVPDWPIEEALVLAKLSLKCAELRRKDRPDLGTVILPELNKLREFAEENTQATQITLSGDTNGSVHSRTHSSMIQEVISDSSHIQSGYEYSKNHASMSSITGRRQF